MSKIYKAKSDIKQELTAYSSTRLYKRDYFSLKHVPLGSLFKEVILDNNTSYLFNKPYTDKHYWCNDSMLGRLYKYNSIDMSFNFRNNDIPTRCNKAVNELTTILTNLLQITRKRVSKSKVKFTVKFFIKHISRLLYHKKYAIKFHTKINIWKQYSGNVSYTYLRELLCLLQDRGDVYKFTGYVDYNNTNICSMFIVTPNFIAYCNSNKREKVLDTCLRSELPPLVEIRDQNKKPRNIRREELMSIEQAKDILQAYNRELEKRTIIVNGITIPELFFRRIHNIDLEHGGRFYDKGEVQGEDSVSRSSILIDGENTTEIDYSGLHYNLALEELGLDLKGKDPYDFPFKIDVDLSTVATWKQEYGFTDKYDPVRNLKKMALLTLFNANSLREAQQGISKSILDDYRKEEPVKRKFVGISNVPVKELVKALLAANNEVSSYMHSGVGSRFQKIDSSMIEYCIKGLMDIGEIGLPVHDSLIVKRDLRDYTVKLMEEAYHHVMGSSVNCKIK